MPMRGSLRPLALIPFGGVESSRSRLYGRGCANMTSMSMRRRTFFLVAAAGTVAVTKDGLWGADIEFSDVKAQSLEFMRWYEQIQLTAAQEAVKKEALGSIPAPCCSDNSAYTCCCECNISRTIWGLSQYMIARQNASAAQVRAKAREWIAFIGPKPPKGYSGSGCYTGQCPRPFSEGGCGGMKADNLVLQ